jgi:hypothetical protein
MIMAYAKIAIKDCEPRNKFGLIPQTTIFSFGLAPYDGTSVDISTLDIKVVLTGGPTSVYQTMSFGNESPNIKITGDATGGYTVKLTLFPNFDTNLESGQRVDLYLKIKDSAGNPMTTYNCKYSVMLSDHYDALTYLLKDVMELTVDYEQGRINHDGTEVEFTYKYWDLASTPKVYKNSIPIVNGYTVDKQNGKIRFNSPLRHTDPVDVITADYKFGVFSENEMIAFLNQSVATYNGFRPMTTYGIGSMPIFADAAMTLGAAFFALQSIGIGFLNQQARVKWGEAEWKELMGQVETIKSKYQEQWNKLLEEKKYNLARPASIYEPSYTLPGGRSRFFRYMFKEGGS